MRKKNSFETAFLLVSTGIGLIILPFAIIKRSFKDWIIVYLVSALGNSFADRYLVSQGFLQYKVRPFKKRYFIHLPFDYLYYPIMLLYYNQWTLNSRPLGHLLKLFTIIIPQVMIETLAERKTNLITWKKGWTWKHSMITLLIKFSICRFIISIVRSMNKGNISAN